MKERGILFSAPMVRALLAGTKTQTRRAARFARGPEPHPQDERLQIVTVGSRGEQFWLNSQPDHLHHISRACPYGQPRDRLWVRETIAMHNLFGFPLGETPQINPVGQRVWSYAADGIDADSITARRPAIHMPRWASRLTLEITAVRVERLQDISEADAVAEGLHSYEHFWRDCEYPLPDVAYEPFVGSPMRYSSAVEAYRALWESINGPGSWDANPWVWVIEFKRVEA